MTEATTSHSYRPGPWFAVLGDEVRVLLPPSEKWRVADVWDRVDEGAGLDEVLDLLVSDGLSGLPGFVLVGTTDTGATILVRGQSRATFTTTEGQVAVTGAGGGTWVERSLEGVTGFRVVVADAGTDVPTHHLGTGLVRVAEVSSPAQRAGTAAADDGGAVPEAADLAETGPVVPFPDSAPPGPIGPEPAWPPTPAEPPVGSASGPPPPVGPPGAHREEPGPGSPAYLTAEGTPDSPEPSSRASRPVARLMFSDGSEVEVDRVVLVGRAPDARRSVAEGEPRLVSVPSPGQEISSTHLEVRPGSGADHGTAVVTDLGSTNGTVLVQPGLGPEELRPGVPVQLVPGAVLDLGDGVTIQVVNP